MVKGVMEEHPPVDSISSSSFLDEILPKWPHPNQDDALFRSSTSRYFCGQGRSDSPFGELSSSFLHQPPYWNTFQMPDTSLLYLRMKWL